MSADCPLRFRCSQEGDPPVPCTPALPHNWRAFREFFTEHTIQQAATLLAASPALHFAAHEASQELGADATPCERHEAAWLASQLELLHSQSPSHDTATQASARRGFRSFAVGSVKAKGWFKATLEKSARGLAGHLFDFYLPVQESGFIGGRHSYSSLLEDLPYALNGFVSLAAGIEDTRLLAKVDEYVDKVLATQGADGWLGPDEWPVLAEESLDRWSRLSASLWARIPMLQALVQYVELGLQRTGMASQACKAHAAVQSFVLELQRRLDAGKCRLVAWSAARWEDLILTLNWLIANPTAHPAGSCPRNKELKRTRLQGLAWLVRVQGFDWEGWFSDGTLPAAALPRANFSLYSHGVNNAMAVKWGAVWGAEFGSQSARQASLKAWTLLQRDHGTASGAFGADEHLAGPAPYRGTELCVVVESMRSLSEAYAALPSHPELADALEKLAFNALPAAMSDDQWAHQYLTQGNAAFAGWDRSDAHEMGEVEHPFSRYFGNVGGDATVYGLSPNFPCCTVNFIQGWPKLLAHGAWRWDDGGWNDERTAGSPAELPLLLSAVFVPSSAAIPEPVGGTVELDTEYPFTSGATLSYTIRNTSSAMTLLVRIPLWADLEQSEVHGLAGEGWSLAAAAFNNDNRPSCLQFDVAPITTAQTWKVRFASRWMLWNRHPWGGGWLQGPLVFVVPLRHEVQELPPDEAWPIRYSALATYSLRDEEVWLADADSWSWGLANTSANVMQLQRWMSSGSYAFESSFDSCPVWVEAPGFQWVERRSELAAWPGMQTPNPPASLPKMSTSAAVLLRPFGCTKLRLSQTPIFQSSGATVPPHSR